MEAVNLKVKLTQTQFFFWEPVDWSYQVKIKPTTASTPEQTNKEHSHPLKKTTNLNFFSFFKNQKCSCNADWVSILQIGSLIAQRGFFSLNVTWCEMEQWGKI